MENVPIQNVENIATVSTSFFDSVKELISKYERNVQKENIMGNEFFNTEDVKKGSEESRKSVSVTHIINDKMLSLLGQDRSDDKPALPFLPNKNGYCDVKAVKTINGYELQGLNQLVAKMYLHERGQGNDNIGTFKSFTDHGTSIRQGERGFTLPFYDKEEGKQKTIRYFAESQCKNREKLPYVPTKEEAKTLANGQVTFVQESANTQEYITNFLTCVHENRPFTVGAEVAEKFKQNLALEIEKNPLAIYKLCNEAAKTIRENELAKKEMNKENIKTKEPKQITRNVEVER